MKFSGKSAAIVAALAMATTGVFALNQTESTAQAATVATVHQGVTARLYTQNGSLITNRALAPNTAWQVGKISNINGVTMYQVSTNEYLKASDSSIMGADANSSKKIGKAAFAPLTLYRDDTNKMANRELAKGSSWQIGKFIRNKNNQEFVQVSTHEYADAALMAYNHPMTNPTYIADFGTNTDFTVIKVGNGDIGTGTPVTPSKPSTPSTSTDTNQGGSTTTTTPSQPSTGTDTNSNTGSMITGSSKVPLPAASDVQSAVLSSINKERASKGLSPVQVDSAVASIAAKRAQEISKNFTHYDANGNELYKTYLHAQTSYLSQGENISLDPWVGLHSSAELANSIMDSFRAEGVSSTWNHYSAIINPNATKVGVGVVVAQDGTIYTVEDFAG